MILFRDSHLKGKNIPPFKFLYLKEQELNNYIRLIIKLQVFQVDHALFLELFKK